MNRPGFNKDLWQMLTQIMLSDFSVISSVAESNHFYAAPIPALALPQKNRLKIESILTHSSPSGCFQPP
jgi:hypothetical protein